jgi:hypothetical protein
MNFLGKSFDAKKRVDIPCGGPAWGFMCVEIQNDPDPTKLSGENVANLLCTQDGLQR